MILKRLWFSGVFKWPSALWFVLVDGSSLSVHSANATSHRLHIAIDLVHLSIFHIELTDKYVGESLAHYPLPLIEGDVIIVDHGYNQFQEIINIIEKGILIVLRLNHII